MSARIHLVLDLLLRSALAGAIGYCWGGVVPWPVLAVLVALWLASAALHVYGAA